MNDTPFKDMSFVLFQIFFSKFLESHGQNSWNYMIWTSENMLAKQKKVMNVLTFQHHSLFWKVARTLVAHALEVFLLY